VLIYQKRLENYHKWGLFREATLVRITSNNKAVSDLCASGNAQLLRQVVLLDSTGIAIVLSIRIRKGRDRTTTSMRIGIITSRTWPAVVLRRRSQQLPARDGGRWQQMGVPFGLHLHYGLRRKW